MKPRCLNSGTTRTLFYITIGIMLLAFYYHIPAQETLSFKENPANVAHVPDKEAKINSKTRYPSNRTPSAKSDEKQTITTNDNEKQLYKIELKQDDGEDSLIAAIALPFTLIKDGIKKTHNAVLEYSRSHLLNAKDPKIQRNTTEDILKHIQLNEENLKPFNNNIGILDINNVIQSNKEQDETTYGTQQFSTTKPTQALPATSYTNLSENENKSCTINIKLAPCKCTRHLHPNLIPCPNKDMTQREIIEKINATLGESTCNDWATLRGNSQKVVSFSAFGSFPNDYYKGALKVIQQISSKYPGWLIRFYHDLNTDNGAEKAWMCSLACKYPQVDFCHASSLPGGLGDLRWTIGTVWRLSVMGDPLIKRFMIRDADSPLLQREVNAVSEWIKSDKCFHIMRDNPAHNQPMMGGMWGGCTSFHPEAMPRLRDTVFRWSRKSTSPLSRDQNNVCLLLWPTLRKNHIAHDAYSCLQYPESQPFPSQRENLTFIGMRAFRKNYAHEQVEQPCPIQCRPVKHKDWIYC